MCNIYLIVCCEFFFYVVIWGFWFLLVFVLLFMGLGFGLFMLIENF